MSAVRFATRSASNLTWLPSGNNTATGNPSSVTGLTSASQAGSLQPQWRFIDYPSSEVELWKDYSYSNTAGNRGRIIRIARRVDSTPKFIIE